MPKDRNMKLTQIIKLSFIYTYIYFQGHFVQGQGHSKHYCKVVRRAKTLEFYKIITCNFTQYIFNIIPVNP